MLISFIKGTTNKKWNNYKCCCNRTWLKIFRRRWRIPKYLFVGWLVGLFLLDSFYIEVVLTLNSCYKSQIEKLPWVKTPFLFYSLENRNDGCLNNVFPKLLLSLLCCVQKERKDLRKEILITHSCSINYILLVFLCYI